MRGEVGEVQPERNLRLRRYIDIRGVWSCLHQKDNVREWLTRSLASCLDIQSAVSVADAAVFSMTFILYFYYCLLAPTTATTVFLPLLSPPSAVVCGFGVFREPRRIDGVGDLKASLAHARTNYSGRGIFSKEIEMHPHVLAFGMPVCLVSGASLGALRLSSTGPGGEKGGKQNPFGLKRPPETTPVW